ncbi:MAG: chorismate lyase [Burkholderiales bacterium]
MNRWKRLAPPHADPWRPWLAWRGSLTWRITARAKDFRVELVRQGPRIPNEDEYRNLGQPAHRRALVREVVLRADGVPVVLAHSIAAWRDLHGAWRGLRGLGTRPLAEALFTDPLVRRQAMEFVRIDSRHPLHRRARRTFGRDFPPLWARRSRFVKHGRPLLVTEVFLPALRDLR